ncbi:MAG TPA: Calx-beta domain-containing protein, partial [Vicinamibacteria bacterium]|nr:Calx-beta domain-containing protein [Vicinamibacteria bacterium]
NEAAYDFRPASGPLVNAGLLPTSSPPGFPFPNPLPAPLFHPPLRAPLAPGAASARPSAPPVDIGAFERSNPALSVADATVDEGNGGTSAATFIVTLSPTSTGPVTVSYGTSDGTATAGSDYAAASGTLTFAPGESSWPVTVTVNGDLAPEANETFFLGLSSPAGAILADPSGLGTLIDEDAAGYFTLPPCRVVDTRGATGPGGGPPLGANTARSFPVVGVCAVPAEAKAVALIVTATGAAQSGNFRIYPTGGPVPLTSVINFVASRARANNAIARLGSLGQLTVRNDMTSGSAHVVLDVFGYFR